jgi:hypothetical protein
MRPNSKVKSTGDARYAGPRVRKTEGQINTASDQKRSLLSAARRLFPAGLPGFSFLRVFPYGGAAG